MEQTLGICQALGYGCREGGAVQEVLDTRSVSNQTLKPKPWAAQVQEYLLDTAAPIWVNLSRGHIELYREIQSLQCGHSAYLEQQFGRAGPFWGRQYLFWHDGKPLTLIHEVFSPALDEYLGEMTRMELRSPKP